mmetsp:Transcript_4268/g.13690  ORF Transcript_4268/g.13690 Transcript_4268/m.13690 type:complete len:357 (+) Transcript_4268:287-1357(+)
MERHELYGAVGHVHNGRKEEPADAGVEGRGVFPLGAVHLGLRRGRRGHGTGGHAGGRGRGRGADRWARGGRGARGGGQGPQAARRGRRGEEAGGGGLFSLLHEVGGSPREALRRGPLHRVGALRWHLGRLRAAHPCEENRPPDALGRAPHGLPGAPHAAEVQEVAHEREAARRAAEGRDPAVGQGPLQGTRQGHLRLPLLGQGLRAHDAGGLQALRRVQVQTRRRSQVRLPSPRLALQRRALQRGLDDPAVGRLGHLLRVQGNARHGPPKLLLRRRAEGRLLQEGRRRPPVLRRVMSSSLAGGPCPLRALAQAPGLAATRPTSRPSMPPRPLALTHPPPGVTHHFLFFSQHPAAPD